MTGIEAIKKIRSTEHGKNLPIIMITSDTGTLKEEAEAMGVFFLSKPFQFADLYSAIDSLKQRK